MLKKRKKRRRDDSSEFDDKEKKGREEPKQVDKLTRKLLQLNVKDDVCVAAYVQLFILVPMSYDRKYLFNNIISFIFYIITNFLLLNSCCLLL